jgi:hypothetical protein
MSGRVACDDPGSSSAVFVLPRPAVQLELVGLGESATNPPRILLASYNLSASRAKPVLGILRLHRNQVPPRGRKAWTESSPAVARPQQQRVGFVVGCAPL